MLRRMIVGLAVGLIGFMFTASVFAGGEAPKTEKKEVKLTGTVKAAAKDSKLACPCTVTVKVDDKDVVYNVRDDKGGLGKKLAQEADGKQAEIVGFVHEKGDTKWLTVKEFKVLEEKKEGDKPAEK